MMRTLAVIAIALAAWTSPSLADTVRAGVPVESLTPAGMTRTKVSAPAAAGLPVRLVYAGDDGAPAVLVDVVVADDAAGARTARDLWLHQATGRFDELADGSFATGTARVFTRDNVMIAVRRIGGSADVAAIAADAARAVDRAPRRRGAFRPVRATIAGTRVELSRPVLAADVRATGPASLRRTRTGWRLARTGDGPLAVAVTAVDDLLRVTHSRAK